MALSFLPSFSPMKRTSPDREPAPPSPSRLVSTDGRALALVSTSLRAVAAGGVARVVVEQRFRNVHAEALSVTYTLPLPADGAVSGFAFLVGARRVVGTVDHRRAARERFERALLEGKTAALLDQERSSVFTQQIGNIPPGEDVVAEITIDQRLAWTDEGGWEWRFPTVVAPRYVGEPGRVPDAAALAITIGETPLEARVSCELAIGDSLVHDGDRVRPESPSHPIDVDAETGAGTRVRLASAEGARLDRDLVVRWRVAARRVGVSARAARPPAGAPTGDCAYALLTLVPPARDAGMRAVPRDLIVLLDTSGSMQGEPLDQARRVVLALLATLTERDQIELIEFSDQARRWQPGPVAAAKAALADARRWLQALRAGSSTEMRDALFEALAPLRPNAQRQVVLITDGLIGSEQEIVAALKARLPRGSRLHTVGVGSAVNRSLTGPAARAGRGVEIVIGFGEDAERAAKRLVARTDAPVVTDLAIEGEGLLGVAPDRLPDLYAGAPLLAAVKTTPAGGPLRVTGVTDEGTLWEHVVELPPLEPGQGDQAVVTLFGREEVEDLEIVAATGLAPDINARIAALGVTYQIATRFTSWVAISQDATVKRPARRLEQVPHEAPHGMSVEALGLRTATSGPTSSPQPFGSVAPSPSMHSLVYRSEAGSLAPRRRSSLALVLLLFWLCALGALLSWLLFR